MIINSKILYFNILLIFVFFFNSAIARANFCNDYADSGCTIEIEMNKSFIKKTEKIITRISVANPEIADVQVITPRQVLLIGKKAGATNLIIWHKRDDNKNSQEEELAEVYDVQVYVSIAIMNAIYNSLRKMVPEAQVNIQRASKGVILDGEVESQQMLERVLSIVRSYVDITPDNNLISIVGSQQVQLEVRIAEVSRSGLKQMGLGFFNNNDWSVGIFSAGQVTGSAVAENTDNSSSSLSGTIDTITGNVDLTLSDSGRNHSRTTNSAIEITSPFSSAFQIALNSVENNSMAILSLLKGQGLSRILASPTLVSMSGQEAEFMVGGEYPFPVKGGDSGQITIEYKRFGIMLVFTPTVVGKETINVEVQPEVSSLDYTVAIASGGVMVPGLRTRRGHTILQLKDGQTFAIAGLINEEVQSSLNKVPFLGDIPILGALFTSKEFNRSETELVIMVTPRLVKALNKDEVPLLPGEGKNDNISDAEFFLMNRVSRPEKTNSPQQKDEKLPEFSGKTGFIR